MNPLIRAAVLIAVLFTAGAALTPAGPQAEESGMSLPEPELDGEVSLEAALAARRSVRSFVDATMSLETLSQLCWAGQGVSDQQRGFRTAPSAGALYPLELYVAAGNVGGIDAGIYRYLPEPHELKRELDGDLREELAGAALGQRWIAEAPVVFVVVGVPERLERRYGPRAERYTILEAGHVGQNIALQAVTRDLGTTMVGAFVDDEVARILDLKSGHQPLYVIPAGEPR